MIKKKLISPHMKEKATVLTVMDTQGHSGAGRGLTTDVHTLGPAAALPEGPPRDNMRRNRDSHPGLEHAWLCFYAC